MRSAMLALLLTTTPIATSAATPAAALLDCADTASLLGQWDQLKTDLSTHATCRESRYPSGNEFECRAATPFSAYGLPVQEFILRESSSGTRELRGVFKASVAGARSAAERRHHGVFEPEGANGWRLSLPGDPPHWLRLDLREDGASELTCVAEGQSAEDARRAGADAAHGAIAGRIAFPTSPLPPMRVCALPTDAARAAYCTVIAEASWSFLIGAVPPGEYVIVAWAERDNPNHYIMAHGNTLNDCAPHAPGCASGMLQRVYVHAGEVLRGVDTLQALTDLPPEFREPPR